MQNVTAQAPDNVDRFNEIYGPADLTATQSLLLTYYYLALKRQGGKVLRETIQATVAHMRSMFGQTFGLKKIRAARQALANKGRITMRYTGRATEIVIVDLRDNKPPSIWDQYVNQFFIDSAIPALTEIYICEDDRSLADRSDRSLATQVDRIKEEKSPVPPKEESKKLDSTNLVARATLAPLIPAVCDLQAPVKYASGVKGDTTSKPRRKKSVKAKRVIAETGMIPEPLKPPRPPQPHIAIIDSWYEKSDPRYRPAQKVYSRYVRLARAFVKAGYTAEQIGAFVEAKQASYQEWAKAKALESRGKQSPPLYMSLEYINNHIAEFAAELKKIAAQQEAERAAYAALERMRAMLGLVPEAA